LIAMRTTFRGMHATEKPRGPDGYFIAQEGVTETSTGSYAVCDCGRVAEVVSHSEVITRVKCDCATADTGCKVLAA